MNAMNPERPMSETMPRDPFGVPHPDPAPKPDYTGLAISQELMAAADRAIGLRIELLKRDARIADLEREVAELKRENV